MASVLAAGVRWRVFVEDDRLALQGPAWCAGAGRVSSLVVGWI